MAEPTAQRIEAVIASSDVVLFMKGIPAAPQCGFSAAAIQILGQLAVPFKTVDVLADDGDSRRHQSVFELADDPAAICQGGVRWRLRHHAGNVSDGRARDADER